MIPCFEDWEESIMLTVKPKTIKVNMDSSSFSSTVTAERNFGSRDLEWHLTMIEISVMIGKFEASFQPQIFKC